MDLSQNKKTVIIISSPLTKISKSFLLEIIKILKEFYNLQIITSGDIEYNYLENIKNQEFIYYKDYNDFRRILNWILLQMKLTVHLINHKREASACLFLSCQSSIIPILAAKLIGIKIILSMGASWNHLNKYGYNSSALFLQYFERISAFLADEIILYSPNLIYYWNLEKYCWKIKIAHKHFLDLNNFKLNISYDNRMQNVGYIGRLSNEKGILNLVKCMSFLDDNIKLLIIGDGPRKANIKKILDENSLHMKVELISWVPNEKIPFYLNTMKLFVLPSYTEGLPHVVIEAMACGTPVLATPVGAIPDIIKDGDTGFIMKNNSPECISANIIRALDHPDLEGISLRARALMEREFTFERTVEKWREVLEEVM